MLTSAATSAGTGTSGDGPVTLIACQGQPFNRVVIYNEGAAPGFFSIDNGSTWGRLPAATASGPGYAEVWHRASGDIQIKRVAGGTDLTKVFGFANDLWG